MKRDDKNRNTAGEHGAMSEELSGIAQGRNGYMPEIYQPYPQMFPYSVGVPGMEELYIPDKPLLCRKDDQAPKL